MRVQIFLTLFFLFSAKTILAQNENKIDHIFKIKIEQSLISSGDNFPDFNLTHDSLDRFLFALHKGFSPNEFQRIVKFSDEKMSGMIALLESKNWLHKVDNQYKPTVFIADSNDGERLYKYAKPLSAKITRSIIENLPRIKLQFAKTEISKTQDFQKWSFLILSDVLLDSWQINNVERDFLQRADRPLRNGNHYYYKISENTNPHAESFGIYGNQYQQTGSQYVSIYGNNRIHVKIITSPNLISQSDNSIFEEMATSFLPALLKVLVEEEDYCRRIYSESGYDKEITFEEFFIWWYHFVYTQATNEMNQKGILTLPTNGCFDYVVGE
jgi:hypothetical protein